jgi:hypothetical protein
MAGPTPVRRDRRHVLVSTAIVILVGCAGDERACTAIGAPPTVSVEVAQVLAQRDVPMHVTVCVGSTCHTVPRRTRIRDGFVQVDEPTVDDEGPVEVRVILETRSGEVLYRTSATVPLERMQPNGPGCDPIKYAVALEATDQGLVPV